MTSSSHTSLCSARQDPDWSNRVKTVSLIECHSGRRVIAESQGLNLRSRDKLSALEPSNPGPIYTRKFRVLPLCSASVQSKFNIVVRRKDILNLFFRSPSLYRGTVDSSCLRKSPPATCSSCSREKIVSKRERNNSLVVLGREQGFSTSVSAIEQGLVLGPRVEDTNFSFDAPWRGHRRLSRVTSARELSNGCGGTRSRSSLAFLSIFGVQVLCCLDHVRVRLTCDIASAQAIGLRQFAEDILSQIQLGRLGYHTCRSQTLAFFKPAAKAFSS